MHPVTIVVLSLLGTMFATWVWRQVDERRKLVDLVHDLRVSVDKLGHDVNEVRTQQVELRHDLVDHMREEERVRSSMLGKFESGLGRVHERIDEVLGKLN